VDLGVSRISLHSNHFLNHTTSQEAVAYHCTTLEKRSTLAIDIERYQLIAKKLRTLGWFRVLFLAARHGFPKGARCSCAASHKSPSGPAL
jgi:hypothetical protein